MTESEIRESVVNIMRSWVGLKEGSAGHKAIIDGYNTISPLPRGYRMSYTAPWCAATVSEAGHQAGLSAIMPAECSCNTMISAYMALGRWVEDDAYVPQPGDLIFYDWQDGDDFASTDNRGEVEHVGMVEAVADGRIIVIEGNISNQVGRRSLTVGGRYIRGYACPDYASRAEKMPSRLNTLEEIRRWTPWAEQTIRSLVSHGSLQGNGGKLDDDGCPTDLSLSGDMLRILIILDRELAFRAKTQS